LSSWLGVDLGGTKLRFDDRVVPLDDRRVEAVVGHIVKQAEARAARGVAISFAGWLSTDGAQVIKAPNLGWGATDLCAVFAGYGLACHLENDVDARAYGEWLAREPAARGDLLTVNAGTGFALGMVINGCVVRGARRRAGEIGHWRPGGVDEQCGCGDRGCLEAAVGGAATSPEALLEPDRAEAWCGRVADALAPVLSALDPQNVLAVGGIFDARSDLRERVAELLGERLPLRWAVPFVWTESAQGESAARRGAIALARRVQGDN
jgi:predicted NBD/HSP70 family sugar kinase